MELIVKFYKRDTYKDLLTFNVGKNYEDNDNYDKLIKLEKDIIANGHKSGLSKSKRGEYYFFSIIDYKKEYNRLEVGKKYKLGINTGNLTPNNYINIRITNIIEEMKENKYNYFA